MFVTDESYSKEDFKEKLLKLGNELANRAAQGVKIQPYYDMGRFVGHDVIINSNNIWLITHNESNGRVGMMRVISR